MLTSDQSGRPGMPGGFSGFSTKPTMRPSASTSMMPNWCACERGTGKAATVRSAPRARWAASI